MNYFTEDSHNPHKQSNNQQAVNGVKARNITMGDIVQQVFQIFLPWSQTGLTRAEWENRYRGILLNRVERFWLSDQSSKERIELRLQDGYDCDAEDIEIASVVTTVANIFREWRNGQALLILGEPGAGKTTALLQLAQNFVQGAREDESSQQLPVVFDLSSWGNERKPIANWLIKELKTKYRVSYECMGKTWLEKRQMVLFLDGLNEVNKEYQSACVREINQFMQDYGHIEIIVCSRIQEYKNLDERLRIEDTVCVQPLTSEQISQYLSEWGDKLKNLKALLQEDAVLQELANTPLMLNVMTQAHEDLPQTGLLEERRRYLLNAYTDQIFKSNRNRFGKKGQKYKEEQVRTWLRWLAQQMSRASSTVFLIEQMQPTWLMENQKKVYQTIVTWYYGILSGFLLGSAYGTILHYYLSHLFPDSETNSTLTKGVIFGMIQGIIVGPAATYFLRIYEKQIETQGKSEFSLRGLRKNVFFSSLNGGIGIGLFVFLICLFFMPWFFNCKLLTATSVGLIAGSFFCIVTVITLVMGDSFVYTPIDLTVRPNQGIWNSRDRSITIGIISAVSIFIFYILIILIFGQIDKTMFILGLCTAVLTGLVTMQSHSSGRSCLLHYALRIVLERDGFIPNNYADFLDYAKDLTFMKKIGGGYKFYHQLFQEDFASPNLNQRGKSKVDKGEKTN